MSFNIPDVSYFSCDIFRFTYVNNHASLFTSKLKLNTLIYFIYCSDIYNDITFFLQKSLGGEGTWLELRHIASYLLWYSQQPAVKQSSGSSSGQSAVKQSSVASSGGYSNHIEELLHELILCVGYFVVLCPDNQVSIDLLPVNTTHFILLYQFII